MASDEVTEPLDGSSMTTSELLAYTQRELDTESERQARIQVDSNGEVLQEAQGGVTLDYSNKNIPELPIEVIALIKDRVERLALSRCPQISIPREIVHCERLRYLNLRGNKLTEFPANVMLLDKLEILDLSKNDLTSIPEGIKAMHSLKFLAVWRNRIERLPLALGDMPNLHKLKFEDNPIVFPTLEELQLPADRQNTKDVDRDRDICQQVKRVLKNKALRQRLLKSSSEEDTSDNNVETPRPPRRTVTGGRFPVRPSVSNIDLSDVSRSASTSPPEITQLTARPSNISTPTKSGLVSTGYVDRGRSGSTSTTASIKARRQGYVQKRSNDLGSVSELTTARASNASTIKATHAYTASNSSVLSSISSSNGADASSAPGSPGESVTAKSKRRPGKLTVYRDAGVHAARRLCYSFHQLYRSLHKIATEMNRGNMQNSLNRHLSAAFQLMDQLNNALLQLSRIAVRGPDETALRRRIMYLVFSALKAFGFVIDAVQIHVQKVNYELDRYHTRTLMHQLYASTIEARNVLGLLEVPIKYAVGSDAKDTPRASRTPYAQNTQVVTPTEPRAPIANKRLRGATILRNEISNSSGLRVIPPARSVDSSRSNTMTSVATSATPLTDTYPMPQSAVLPMRRDTMRSMLNTSSDEQEDAPDQFEQIYLRLRHACEIADKALPACHHEVMSQLDSAQREGSQASRLWQNAYKSYTKVAGAHIDLRERLGAIKFKDPGVRHQRDFWSLCDSFVLNWTTFAVDVKKLSSSSSDITTLRSLMKPMQRAVKDLSKLISESPMYHHVMNKNTSMARGDGPSLALNTAAGQAVAIAGSAPSSANPLSAHAGLPVSVPATPLAAALGPAAQATISGTPAVMTGMSDYFGERLVTRHERADTLASMSSTSSTGIGSAPNIALPPLPAGVQSHHSAAGFVRRQQ